MATGIVSVGLSQALPALSAALLWLTATCYVVLVLALLWRIAAFRTEIHEDMTDPSRAFGFFTFVAGTDVLGTRFALEGHDVVAGTLLAVGALSWLVLGYLVPWKAVLNHGDRPSLARANGTWFIWIVAGQSVAVLSATLQPRAGSGANGLALLAVVAWSVGVVLYLIVGALVAVRLVLHELHPIDLSPAYWVAMGATAITVLAGSKILHMTDTPVITNTRHLITGTSVVFWAFGTWLVPALVAAGWWRHVKRRTPLHYDPTWWSIVFPLGMYGVATGALGTTEQLPVANVIGEYEVRLALAAWAVTFTAMLVNLFRTLLRKSPSSYGGARRATGHTD